MDIMAKLLVISACLMSIVMGHAEHSSETVPSGKTTNTAHQQESTLDANKTMASRDAVQDEMQAYNNLLNLLQSPKVNESSRLSEDVHELIEELLRGDNKNGSAIQKQVREPIKKPPPVANEPAADEDDGVIDLQNYSAGQLVYYLQNILAWNSQVRRAITPTMILTALAWDANNELRQQHDNTNNREGLLLRFTINDFERTLTVTSNGTGQTEDDLNRVWKTDLAQRLRRVIRVYRRGGSNIINRCGILLTICACHSVTITTNTHLGAHSSKRFNSGVLFSWHDHGFTQRGTKLVLQVHPMFDSLLKVDDVLPVLRVLKMSIPYPIELYSVGLLPNGNYLEIWHDIFAIIH